MIWDRSYAAIAIDVGGLMAKLIKHPAGWRVTFRHPDTKELVVGEIVDEVWAVDPEEFEEHAPENSGWRQAAFVAQLVEWPESGRRVRITYYVRPEGGGPHTWRFGGQYAASMSVEEFRSLVGKLAPKNW